jgi:hypothetical protein
MGESESADEHGAELIARNIDFILNDSDREITISDGLATAILMFLQYVIEEGQELPAPMIAAGTRINNALGHETYRQSRQ